jgi:hypothetical protein
VLQFLKGYLVLSVPMFVDWLNILIVIVSFAYYAHKIFISILLIISIIIRMHTGNFIVNAVTYIDVIIVFVIFVHVLNMSIRNVMCIIDFRWFLGGNIMSWVYLIQIIVASCIDHGLFLFVCQFIYFIVLTKIIY